MSKIDKFRGTGVALVTPFDKKGKVDFRSLERVVHHVIKGGVDYIVSMGTTGETPVLSMEEKEAIIKHTVQTVKQRVPVVMGLGGNNTQEVIDTIGRFDLDGIDGILSVSPYYNKPNQRGIVQHFKAVAENCPLPVIVYNVPARTSSNITAETILKLAKEVKNIVAVKEASGNIDQVMQIIKNKPKDFLVISGDDLITLPLIASGGDGVISVIANAFPQEFSAMVREVLKGNYLKARKLHYSFDEFIRLIFADGSPAGIKCLLNIMQVAGPFVRLPLVQVNPQVEKVLRAAYFRYKNA